jgi:hypothetical protein
MGICLPPTGRSEEEKEEKAAAAARAEWEEVNKQPQQAYLESVTWCGYSLYDNGINQIARGGSTRYGASVS